MAKRKTRGLGATADVHEYQMKRGIRMAQQATHGADVAARNGDCAGVWEQLLIARANTSHAYANAESFNAPASLENQRLRLEEKLAHQVNTIGFQCTRKK